MLSSINSIPAEPDAPLSHCSLVPSVYSVRIDIIGVSGFQVETRFSRKSAVLSINSNQTEPNAPPLATRPHPIERRGDPSELGWSDVCLSTVNEIVPSINVIRPYIHGFDGPGETGNLSAE